MHQAHRESWRCILPAFDVKEKWSCNLLAHLWSHTKVILRTSANSTQAWERRKTQLKSAGAREHEPSARSCTRAKNLISTDCKSSETNKCAPRRQSSTNRAAERSRHLRHKVSLGIFSNCGWSLFPPVRRAGAGVRVRVRGYRRSR